ncbi:MAG: isochorismatase family cysteine hydrolase [Rhodospirillales bacterium]|jgi:ureidoacrylate peracid hydrolase|nr:isochorismatase family cysteine hydrolase [Rhodospirillales bacterium]
MTEILSELTDRLNPAHTAVVVIDMQNDFCAEGGYLHNMRGVDMSSNEPLAGRIMNLVGAAREAGAMVIWIKANYEPRYLSGQALLKRQLGGNESVCCAGGSWGWDFYKVEAAPDEWVIEKHTYSGFAGTELDRILHHNGIKSLVFTGVATNVCVESTLRDGYFAGYYIFMPEDCVGSAAQDLHEATIKNVQVYLGEVAPSPEIMEVWADAGQLREAG